VISCQDALDLIYEYLDGELENVPEEQVRAHFEACQRCFPHLKLEEAFRAAVHRATRGKAAPAELRTRVIALLAEMDPG
jgi:anti-sigma factor (TIGR02949 family)